MSSSYKDWMDQQEADFQYEVCYLNEIKDRFFDYQFRAISLEELQQLDMTYIFRKAVLSDQQGGAQEIK